MDTLAAVTGNPQAWQRFLLQLLGTLPHYRPGFLLEVEA